MSIAPIFGTFRPILTNCRLDTAAAPEDPNGCGGGSSTQLRRGCRRATTGCAHSPAAVSGSERSRPSRGTCPPAWIADREGARSGRRGILGYPSEDPAAAAGLGCHCLHLETVARRCAVPRDAGPRHRPARGNASTISRMSTSSASAAARPGSWRSLIANCATSTRPAPIAVSISRTARASGACWTRPGGFRRPTTRIGPGWPKRQPIFPSLDTAHGCVGLRGAVDDPPWFQFLDRQRTQFEFSDHRRHPPRSAEAPWRSGLADLGRVVSSDGLETQGETMDKIWQRRLAAGLPVVRRRVADSGHRPLLRARSDGRPVDLRDRPAGGGTGRLHARHRVGNSQGRQARRGLQAPWPALLPEGQRPRHRRFHRGGPARPEGCGGLRQPRGRLSREGRRRARRRGFRRGDPARSERMRTPGTTAAGRAPSSAASLPLRWPIATRPCGGSPARR